MCEEGYAKADFERLKNLFSSFKYEFQTHILKENVKFYACLKQKNMTEDAHALRVIREFRRDMNDIAFSSIILTTHSYLAVAITIFAAQ